MAKMSMTKIRGFFAGVFALLLVIVLAALATAVMGKDLPGLGTIARTLGVNPADHVGGE